MHSGGPWKVPEWIFNDDGKRSRAVDVSEFKGEANCEGGFGGKQVGVLVDWFQFQSLFFVFFLMRLEINFLCI